MESRGVLALAFFGQVQTSSRAPWKLMLTILSAGIEAMIAEDCWYKNASICLSWGEFHEVSLVLLVLNITILSITSDATDKVRNLSREVSCLSFGTWDLCEEDRTVWTHIRRHHPARCTNWIQLDVSPKIGRLWSIMIHWCPTRVWKKWSWPSCLKFSDMGPWGRYEASTGFLTGFT